MAGGINGVLPQFCLETSQWAYRTVNGYCSSEACRGVAQTRRGEAASGKGGSSPNHIKAAGYTRP